MRILVTGASGFIGSHVCAALAAAGGKVLAFCRTEPPPGAMAADWIAGDITDPVAVAAAVGGCQAVVHTAALYSYRRADAPLMRAVNVEGTRNLLRASVRAGVRRVLVTSTSSTCGPVRGRPATERDRPTEWELQVPYKRTKLAAERIALAHTHDPTEVLCVNPTTVVGEGDHRPTPSGRMIQDLVEGRMKAYLPRAGINVVSVRDVARGHVLALSTGRPGQRYILGGDDLPLREAFAVVLGQVGRSAPRWPVPWHAVYAAAVAAAAIGRVVGREPELIVRDEVRLSRMPLYFSSAKARRELGYEPEPAAVALANAARWFASRRSTAAAPARAIAPAH